MATPKSPFRAFKANLTVSYGVVSCVVDLVPPLDTRNDVQFESSCPTCHHLDPQAPASKVGTMYHCSEHPEHGPFATADVAKAVASDNGLRVIGSAQDVSDIRADNDAAANTLTLRPFFADEVERSTYPIGTAYVLVQKGHSQTFPLFLALLDHAGHVAGERPMVLIGEVTLRNVSKLVQLRRWNDLLVIQELAHPDDLKSGFASCPDQLDERFLGPISQLMAAEVSTFEPAAFNNPQRLKMREFADARLNGTVSATVAPVQRVATATDDNILSLLQASVKAVAKPKTRKPRARKAAPVQKAS